VGILAVLCILRDWRPWAFLTGEYLPILGPALSVLWAPNHVGLDAHLYTCLVASSIIWITQGQGRLAHLKIPAKSPSLVQIKTEESRKVGLNTWASLQLFVSLLCRNFQESGVSSILGSSPHSGWFKPPRTSTCQSCAPGTSRPASTPSFYLQLFFSAQPAPQSTTSLPQKRNSTQSLHWSICSQ
jgi:hypothetical protein